MFSKRAPLAAVGVFLACAGASLMVPSLPLRLSLPALLLLVALVIPERFVEESLRTFTLVAVWVWVAGCLLAAPAGSARTIAFALVTLGLALGLPAAAAGLRAASYFTLPLDTGLAIGSAFLAILGLALGFLWPQRIPVRLHALSILLGVTLGGYLISRNGAGEKERLRRAAAVGLILAGAACLVGLGLWRTAALRAQRLESGGEVAAALRASNEEVTWTRALGLPGIMADALRRRARVCGRAGDLAARRQALREIAALDPADLATLHDLFLLALDDRDGSPELLEIFRRLPDGMLDAASAGRVAARALHTGSWEVFSRAWRLSGGRLPAQDLDPGKLAVAGEALYFRGDHRTAADLLRRSLEERHDWNVSRVLIFALLREGRAGEAREILAAVETTGHETEAAWLQARIAHGEVQAPGAGGASFAGILKLTGCRLESAAAVSGGEVTVSFAWEVLAPVPPDWRVFVHARQEVYGGFFFQGDHEFGDVGHPARELECGSRFEYTVRFPVPQLAPLGDYSVVVGLWDGRENRPVVPVPPLPPGFRITAGDRVRLEPGLRIGAKRSLE